MVHSQILTGFKILLPIIKLCSPAMKPHSDGGNIMILDDSKFYYKTDILAATTDKNAEVRGFAIRAANANFKKEQNLHERYRDIIQCFAVFKKINRNWNYVNDPVGQEYFAKASESVNNLPVIVMLMRLSLLPPLSQFMPPL